MPRPSRGVDFWVNKYIGDDPYLCRAVNLRPTAIVLRRLRDPDQPLGEVTLEFQLPGDEQLVRCRGLVFAEDPSARTQGIRFLDFATDGAARIEQFLAGLQSFPIAS